MSLRLALRLCSSARLRLAQRHPTNDSVVTASKPILSREHAKELSSIVSSCVKCKFTYKHVIAIGAFEFDLREQ